MAKKKRVGRLGASLAGSATVRSPRPFTLPAANAIVTQIGATVVYVGATTLRISQVGAVVVYKERKGSFQVLIV
jgi:hypothetical protein